MSKVFAVYLFLALLGQSGILFADVIYKSVGKDGVVTYSDTPVPGAVSTETIQVDTLSPEERRAVLIMQAKQKTQDRDTLERRRAKEDEWRKVDQEILAAQAALKNAEEDLENGRAPLPGETKGTAGRFARLTESYFQRLESLEQAVKDARARLDEAYQARDQLR
ncbi:MAG TPA: DUF4124 domain-containing protein [Burkholderiales bacterium]|nr:DUF4124 domain-containing protein [Burkholderiales bacterium]